MIHVSANLRCSRAARIADSSSINALSFSSARTMNSRQTGTRARRSFKERVCAPARKSAESKDHRGFDLISDALPSEIEGGCVRAVLGTLPFAFRSTEWDDVIVDVHEKTTTIEVRILCTPRLDSLGNTVGSHGCLQHLWLSKNLASRRHGLRRRARGSFKKRVRAPAHGARTNSLSSCQPLLV